MLLQKTFQWPPDYVAIYERRQQMLQRFRSDATLIVGAKAHYRNHPADFIEDWCDTQDTRRAHTGKLVTMPFVLFPRQREFIEFLHACLLAESNGLVEKCRDMGATWLCCAFSVWLFLFIPGAVVGWGSKDASQVDVLGNPNTIFEKMRMLLRWMPRDFLPTGFGEKQMGIKKIYDPVSGSAITGEGGDNIGRGSRTLIFFKDEAALYEHAEAIEAALQGTTRVQIDVSTPHGLGTVFHRKRESGIEWQPGTPGVKGRTNVFVMDWSDHPEKTQEWHDELEKKAISEGLLHIFRREVDRNYADSVEGVVIPSEWVVSAIDAHVKLGIPIAGAAFAGLDVADGGGDRNALVVRRGITLVHAEEWGERDTGMTARRAVGAVDKFKPVDVQYDSIGVGAGVKAETNRLHGDRLMPLGIKWASWEAGAKVVNPDDHVEKNDRNTPLNKDMFQNMKAQAWWWVRRRFEKTHKAVAQGERYSPDELISIDSKCPLLRSIQKELSQPTMDKSATMKLVIDKMPEGTRSPNLADAIVMCYFPVPRGYDTSLAWVNS